MKILNRPMFRMGGPIKEGIMNGIQEPRRIGYAVKGTVSASDQAKAFENIFTTPQVTQEQVNMFAKKGTPYSNMSTPKVDINSLPLEERIKIKLDNRGPLINSAGVEMENTGKGYIGNEPGLDRTTKEFFSGIGSGRGQSKEYIESLKEVENLKNKKLNNDSAAVTGGKSPFKYTLDGGVKPDIPEANERALTKKERTNNILEMLGYDKAKKGALYDAMINAGQRISRTGLGADNLVSDVIADTSRSYDKPEKLREAANLMDVQQQLKLDQIDASKTGGSLKQNYDFYKDQGYDNKTAERMAKGLPVTITEKFNASKATSSSGKVYNVTQEIVSEGFFGKDKEYKGKIDTSDHKNLTEFLSSEEYKTKGDGVYNVKGEAVLIENGVPVKRQIIQPQSDKKGWFS
jgi:hypothetical protein